MFLSVLPLPSLGNSLFNASDKQLIDPSYVEECCMDGDMTFVANSHREVCAIQKAGGEAIDLSRLMYCANIAVLKSQELEAIIKKAIASQEEPVEE